MRREVAAELRKIVTVPTVLWFFPGLLALALLYSVLPAMFTQPYPDGTFIFEDETAFRGIASPGTLAGPVAVLFGIMHVTSEFRHRTIATTLLVTPRYARVLIAKCLSVLPVGLLIGLAGSGLSLLLVPAIVRNRGFSSPLSATDTAEILAGGLAHAALAAVLGVGLGALLRSQLGAFVLATALLLVVEPLLSGLLDAARWFPGRVGLVLAGAWPFPGAVSAWVAALVYAAYAAATVALAWLLTLRRDVP